jgi:hypothetical protein
MIMMILGRAAGADGVADWAASRPFGPGFMLPKAAASPAPRKCLRCVMAAAFPWLMRPFLARSKAAEGASEIPDILFTFKK